MQLQRLKLLDRALARLLALLPQRQPRRPPPVPRSILVIKLSAMGDVLCMLPAVRMLSAAFPEASIDWMTTHRSQPGFFRNVGFIRRTMVLPTGAAALLKFLLGHFSALRRYDLIVDFDQYYQFSEFIAYLGRGSAGFQAPLKGKTFQWSVDYDPKQSEKLQFKRLVEHLIRAHDRQPPVYAATLPELLTGYQPSEAAMAFRDRMAALGRPVLAIYPGSSANATFRRWGIDKYIDLIERLRGQCTMLVVGGPDEVSLKQALQDAGMGDQDQINQWSLFDLTWLFGDLIDLFVGNDGGLLHIAEAQGVPVVGIFGPALFAKWGSIHPKSRPVEIELPCRPCLRNYLGEVPSTCSRGDVACLARITPVDVLAEVQQVLAADTVGAAAAP